MVGEVDEKRYHEDVRIKGAGVMYLAALKTYLGRSE